jgi:hypothetical protein
MLRLAATLCLLLAAAASALPPFKGYESRGAARRAAKDLAKLSRKERKDLWRAWKAEACAENPRGHDCARQDPDASARYATWSANLDAVILANAAGDAPTVQGLNAYSDLTFDEFRATVLMKPREGARPPAPAPAPEAQFLPTVAPTRKLSQARSLSQAVPLAVDWRAAGKVPPVRNQGSCGSCWAFAAAATVEIQAAIQGVASGADTSEQQTLDCSSGGSCNGGGAEGAFEYIANNYAAAEALYPYAGAQGTCHNVSRAGALGLSSSPGYTYSGWDAPSIMQAVSQGPVAITFNANGAFQSYAGGIFQASQCPEYGVNHAMAVVGYNATAGVGSPDSYWIVRNSWGAGWGEGGYARVQMIDGEYGACFMYYWFSISVVPPTSTAAPPPPSPKPPSPKPPSPKPPSPKPPSPAPPMCTCPCPCA